MLLLSPFKIYALPIDDSFDGNTLNWCRWEDISSGGSVTQSGELALSPDGTATFASARLLSQARLVGDFDIQVDYRLDAEFNAPVTGSGFPQLNATLGLTWDAANYIYLSRTHAVYGDGVSVYASLPELAQNNSRFSSTSAQSGTLRTIRLGSQLRYLYRAFGSTDWAELAAMTVPSTPVFVTLAAYHVNIARKFTAYFDNLKLNVGQTDDISYTQPTSFRKRADFALGGVSENWPALKYFSNRFKTFDPLATFRDRFRPAGLIRNGPWRPAERRCCRAARSTDGWCA